MPKQDKPGALAKVAAALGEAGVSINRMRQYSHQDNAAPVLIVTHPCARVELDAALAVLPGTGVVEGSPVALRIEEV
jgi:homoserine dehydrogenase